MKVAVYLRVSTEAQTEGLGLAVQEATITEWAKKNGHKIVATYTDAGVSGSNGLDNRTGLADALAALKDDRAVGIVVYRLDRLARDMVLQEQLLAELGRMGAAVFSTSDTEAAVLTDDPDDPSRQLVRQILGAVAQFERSMIALRLRAGRAKKANDGGFAFGSPPYGWQAVDGELVPAVEEQGILTDIRAMRDAGKSYREVAAVLNAAGIKPRRGRVWHPGVLNRLVDRSPP